MAVDEQKRRLCEQVTTLLAMHGNLVNDEVLCLMEPLLDGRLTYAEHQAWLQAMINSYE